MLKICSRVFLSILFILVSLSSFSQTLSIGTPVLEETWRRLQISDKRDNNISFSVRPIYGSTVMNYDSIYHLTGSLAEKKSHSTFHFANGKGMIRLLPVTFKQQYNTHHPYGWNDGAMIQATGYQNQFSLGFHTKIGPLSIQLQPEIVYAQNRHFSTFPPTHNDTIGRSYYYLLNSIDNPEKYGHGSYAKVFPGQSSVRFNFKKLSLGVSNENLWWGPGTRNALIMSNNAPGFQHITFNTTSPVISPFGSFEWQLISGTLKGSGILPEDTSRTFLGQRLYSPKIDDDRYLNGMVITWQPKWTKGLFLGVSRVFYIYENELQHSIGSYLPIFSNLFKGNNVQKEDTLSKDQMLSIFFRLVLSKEKAELYAEFGRNDHSSNLRDLVLEPEHARAYTIGARKIFDTKKGTEVELLTEITTLQVPATAMVRELNSWYSHQLVRHGYTNRGQIIGAGIGTGSSSQTIGVNWIKEIDKFGVTLERVVRNNDFYYSAIAPIRRFGGHWVDLSVNLNKSWHRKHFIYNVDLSLIRSLNYQWRNGEGRDVNNIHAGFSVSYLF